MDARQITTGLTPYAGERAPRSVSARRASQVVQRALLPAVGQRSSKTTASIRAPLVEGDDGNVTTGWFTELMAGDHLWLLRRHPDFECDFETARRIVYSDARKTWDGFGTLYVAPYGSEDATHWQVIVGAREDIVEHDWMFMVLGAPLVLVDKSTGEISRHVAVESFARLDGMSRVGPWPDEMDFA